MKKSIISYYEKKIRKLRQQAFDYDITDNWAYVSHMSKVNTEMIKETQGKLSEFMQDNRRTTECTGGYSFLNIG
jgi:hypothetical protein